MSSNVVMQPPQSVAAMIHPQVDYKDLLKGLAKTIATDPHPKARVKFCAENLEGGATLGLMEAFNRGSDTVERARRAVSAILNSPEGRTKTGVELGLNHLPGMLVTDPLLSVVISSSVLTVNDVLDVKARIKAKDGCTIHILCQPTRAIGGECTGFHTETLAIPHSAADGEPIDLTVVLVPPEKGDWLVAREIIKQTVGCDRLGPVKTKGDLAKAFCTPEGTQALGPDNMLLCLVPEQFAATLAEFSPRRKLGKPHLEPNYPVKAMFQPLEFAMAFDCDEDGMSRFLQLRELQRLSLERGETLTFGSHYGFASCETYSGMMVKAALPHLFEDIDPSYFSLKTLTRLLCDKADRHYVMTKPELRIYDYCDREKHAAGSRSVSKEALMEKIDAICDDNNLNRQLSADLPSWNNWFNNAYAVPEDTTARYVYHEVFMAALHWLEERADILNDGRDTAPVEDLPAEFTELVSRLKDDRSPWAGLIGNTAKNPVDDLVEKMSSLNPGDILDAASLMDIQDDMAGLVGDAKIEPKWAQAMKALETLAEYAQKIEEETSWKKPSAQETDFRGRLAAQLDDYLAERTPTQRRTKVTRKPFMPETLASIDEVGETSRAPPALRVQQQDAAPEITPAAPTALVEAMAFLPADNVTGATQIPEAVRHIAERDPSVLVVSEEELRRQAFELIGIIIDQNPSRATHIKAICLAILKSVPDVGIALMFFWQVIRYAYSEDGGVTVTPGQNAVAVLSYTITQPMMERFTEAIALSMRAHRVPKAPLTYPRRLVQEYSNAFVGGPLIGVISKFINDVPHPDSGSGRLGWELLAVIPGLLIVAANRILGDFFLFKQEYEILGAKAPGYRQAKQLLLQIWRDFLSIEHWVQKRLVTFIALYAHEWTQRSWYYLFQKIANPYYRSFAGAAQFGTFFVSFVFISQIAEKLIGSKDRRRARRITAENDI